LNLDEPILQDFQ
jgi:hypothetical protein